MIKKILKSIFLSLFVPLLSSYVFVHSEQEPIRYYTVTIENNSKTDIIDWYLIDINNGNKYGRNDESSIIEEDEYDKLQFIANREYKCYIYFDTENIYKIPETETLYLNKNLIITITGSRRTPEYSISTDYSRNIDSQNNNTNMVVEISEQK
ncbi:MAG: hypothetical protein J6C25_04880 [Treponema sp.]|nr:hypothetical protein [Treponema sp.]